MDFKEYKNQVLIDDIECAEEFERLRPYYEIISKIIESEAIYNTK